MLDKADRAALPAGLADAYPLARVQLGMVIEMLSDPGVNKYHNCTSFRIHDTKPFSAEAMHAAVAILVDRHEVLRTAIDLETFTVPMQLVHKHAKMAVRISDLSHL